MSRPLMLATCPTNFGAGGLGQHLACVREDALADGFDVLVCCHGGIDSPVRGGEGMGKVDCSACPPFRHRPDLSVWLRHVVFDRRDGCANRTRWTR
jgi:hypothetical protein